MTERRWPVGALNGVIGAALSKITPLRAPQSVRLPPALLGRVGPGLLLFLLSLSLLDFLGRAPGIIYGPGQYAASIRIDAGRRGGRRGRRRRRLVAVSFSPARTKAWTGRRG